MLSAFRQRLPAYGLASSGLLTLAAAGSLGRLEVHAASDFDLVAINAGGGAEDDALAPVFALGAELGLALPKSHGIYRETLPRGRLCPPDARGSLKESPAAFGKRMSLLLDARPLWGDDAFNALRVDVLDWYAAGRVGRLADAQWDFLLHDLQRYAHAYAGWQAFHFEREASDGWLLRQAKLAGSRLITFAGLLCLLGASSTMGREKLPWVSAQLALTPLQRLRVAMAEEPAEFSALCADYEALHARLSHPTARAALVADSPLSLEAALLPSAARRDIECLGNSLRRRVANFVLARRGEWHPDFFAALLF